MAEYRLKTYETRIAKYPGIIIRADSEYGNSIRIILPEGQVLDVLVTPDYVKEPMVYVGLSK